jgi:hypothetical protein
MRLLMMTERVNVTNIEEVRPPSVLHHGSSPAICETTIMMSDFALKKDSKWKPPLEQWKATDLSAIDRFRLVRNCRKISLKQRSLNDCDFHLFRFVWRDSVSLCLK